MGTFIKAQASSLTASAVDFLVTYLLKQLFHWSMSASILGTVAGGVVNFTMNRSWVFEAHKQHKRIHFHVFKYVIVWIGNLLLVSGGVYALTRFAGMELVMSKVIVSLIVGYFYNYILQKRFVFK